MATKQYNKQTFTAEVNGQTYSFHCWTSHQWDGFCHNVWCDDIERLTSGKSATTRTKYYNRTWERFDYETTLKKAIEKFPKAMRESLTLQLIEKKSKEEIEKAEKQLEDFKRLHDGLTDRQKQILAQTPPMETQEDVRRTMGIMGMFNLMNQMSNQ